MCLWLGCSPLQLLLKCHCFVLDTYGGIRSSQPCPVLVLSMAAQTLSSTLLPPLLAQRHILYRFSHCSKQWGIIGVQQFHFELLLIHTVAGLEQLKSLKTCRWEINSTNLCQLVSKVNIQGPCWKLWLRCPFPSQLHMNQTSNQDIAQNIEPERWIIDLQRSGSANYGCDPFELVLHWSPQVWVKTSLWRDTSPNFGSNPGLVAILDKLVAP